MPEIGYCYRRESAHNDRWIRLLSELGSVTSWAVTEQLPARPFDLVVAGPLTDATLLALSAVDCPVVGLSWAFDLIHEVEVSKDPHFYSTLAACAAIHVDCRFLRDLLVSRGLDKSRISVAPWGIDLNFYTPLSRQARAQLRSRLGVDQGDIVIFSARPHEQLYNPSTVLEAAAHAASAHNRIRVAMGGAGTQSASLRDLAHDLGIAPRVKWLSALDPLAMRDWLRAADVYVTAAASDGSSLSLMEALACGTPAIVPALGGNPEWVDDEGRGRLFPAGDVTRFAEAILSTAGSGRSVESEGHRRRVVVQHGDWSRNATAILVMLRSVMEAGR